MMAELSHEKYASVLNFKHGSAARNITGASALALSSHMELSTL